MSDDSEGLQERRERVVAAVLKRIAAGPELVRRPAPLVDLASWRVPALVAAALILVAAGLTLRSQRAERGVPRTVAESLGFPQPISGMLEAGQRTRAESSEQPR